MKDDLDRWRIFKCRVELEVDDKCTCDDEKAAATNNGNKRQRRRRRRHRQITDRDTTDHSGTID